MVAFPSHDNETSRTYGHSEARTDDYTPPTPGEAELKYAYSELPEILADDDPPDPARHDRKGQKQSAVMKLMGDNPGSADEGTEAADEEIATRTRQTTTMRTSS